MKSKLFSIAPFLLSAPILLQTAEHRAVLGGPDNTCGARKSHCFFFVHGFRGPRSLAGVERRLLAGYDSDQPRFAYS